MNVNFYPERSQMAKEVDKCVSQGRTETLLSFCNSCMLRSLPVVLAPDCMSCKVGHALASMAAANGAPEGQEYLKFC